MSYKVIFLDWGGVLSVSRFWEHWAKDYPEDFAIIQHQLFAKRPDLIEQWMRGKVTAEASVATITDMVAASKDELLEGLRRSCQQMQFIDFDLPAIVKQLQQQGSRVVVATDNMDTFYRWTAEAMDLANIFDDMLISAQLGALKVDKDSEGKSLFFSTYLDNYGVLPGQSLLIDDSSTNGLVKQFGIDFMQVEPGKGIAPVLKELI